MKALLWLIIPITLGFTLPYYWEYIADLEIQLTLHVLSNLLGFVVGVFAYSVITDPDL